MTYAVVRGPNVTREYLEPVSFGEQRPLPLFSTSMAAIWLVPVANIKPPVHTCSGAALCVDDVRAVRRPSGACRDSPSSGVHAPELGAVGAHDKNTRVLRRHERTRSAWRLSLPAHDERCGSRSEENAIQFPSGDHCGRNSPTAP